MPIGRAVQAEGTVAKALRWEQPGLLKVGQCGQSRVHEEGITEDEGPRS
jgi:hypothetical protein